MITVRECNDACCRDWGAARCVHFDGKVLRLLDVRLLPNVVTDPDEGVPYITEIFDGDITELYAGNSEADALAAFDAAERQLLGRGA